MGYVDQNQLELIGDGTEALADVLPNRVSIGHTENIRELVHAGFPVRAHNLKMSELSDGERSRMMFVVLKHIQPNFFLMDEPTNHLDIDGQNRLEDQILSNASTCLFVSHDRAFVSELANRVCMIEDGKLVELSEPQDFYDKLKIG